MLYENLLICYYSDIPIDSCLPLMQDRYSITVPTIMKMIQRYVTFRSFAATYMTQQDCKHAAIANQPAAKIIMIGEIFLSFRVTCYGY